MTTKYTYLPTVLEYEIAQRRVSGFDVSAIEKDLANQSEITPELARELLTRLAALEASEDWPYVEPSTLEGIQAELPASASSARLGLADLRDRLEAAWLGRCAGNCLGNPVEDGGRWSSESIAHYLRRSGNYPINDYLRRLDPMPEGLELCETWSQSTKGRIKYVPRDDDLDYTLLGLHIMERHGFGFTTADVAKEWLLRLPFHLTYSAERSTYRNLVNGVPPEECAVNDNPYREWSGAQMRGDIFGYVCAGRPRAAAILSYPDASMTHVGNGIYAEMWAAALIAASFTATSLRDAVLESFNHVPQRSRLAEGLRWTLALSDSGVDWENAITQLLERYGQYHWRHAVPNAAVCALALLRAEDDYTRAIGFAVQSGLDADTNGATVGSAAGAFSGRAGIPPHWTAPFGDTLRSGLAGFDRTSIRSLAEQTFALARAALTRTVPTQVVTTPAADPGTARAS